MTARPRLLMVSGSFPDISCGVSGHVKLIAERTARRGEFDLGVLTSDDPAVDCTQAAGYQVYPHVKKWGALQAWNICREILDLSPEIVCIQNPTVKYNGRRSLTMSAAVPLLKRMAPKVRVVVMQHDIAISQLLLRRRYYPLFRWADAVIVSNTRDYQAVAAQGIKGNKLYLAPLSGHFQMPQPAKTDKKKLRVQMGIDAECICVAYFGYIHRRRNVDMLIRALARLHGAGHNVHGLMIGGPPHNGRRYYQHCQQLADKLRLKDHITWTGYASEKQIVEGLGAADVFVSLPARGADRRNTSVITAMQARLPIITCENPTYYIDDDLRIMGCHFTQPRDPAAIASSILEVYETGPKPDFLGRLGEFLDFETCWDEHAAITICAYRGVSPPHPRIFRAD